MSSTHPVPMDVVDDIGRPWHVVRAWPDKTPGDYLLEVRAQGRTGVRAAHLRRGHFTLVPEDDPGLPALRAEAQCGEIIAHHPHKRALIRAGGRYAKVFRPGRAVVPAERCAQMDALLVDGTFVAPRIVRRSADVLVFDAIPGRTLRELGQDPATCDESFTSVWMKWSRAWTAQLSAPYGTARRNSLANLPLHPAEREAADVWLWVDRWTRHHENIPGAWPQRDVVRARAHQIAENLLRTTPDPLVWAHGDLHDKQIIGVDGESPLGLLDFDAAAQAEAARDLAPSEASTRTTCADSRAVSGCPCTGTGRLRRSARESRPVPRLRGRHAYPARLPLFLPPRVFIPGVHPPRQTGLELIA